MRWMNTNARGTVAYWAIGLERSNVCAHDLARVLLRPRHRGVLGDGRVEVGEVLADLGGVDRRSGQQQSRPARRGARNVARVVVDRRRLHQPGEHGDLVGAEVADEPEVEERDPPVAVEQVVAGVRIAVERLHPVEAAEHEAEQPLADQVALDAGPTSAPRARSPRRRGRSSAPSPCTGGWTTSGTEKYGWPR